MKISFARFVLAAVLATAGFAQAAPAIDEFAFAVPLETAGGDAFYRLVIPQAVYEASAFADLRDLRVFNGGGEPVPYAFRAIALRAQKAEPVALAIFPLRGPRNTRAEDLDLSVGRTGDTVNVRLRNRGDASAQQVLLGYLIDASAVKNPLTGITVRWGAAGADRLTSVRLETSSDLRNWAPLANDVPLGGVSHAGQRLERDSIEFRSGREKYLRLTWPDPDKSIELDAIHGNVSEQWEQPERIWKEIATKPDGGKPGDYLFDLDGRFPVDRLEFRLPQQNTVVPVQIFVRDDPKEKWRPLAATIAYRLQQEGREVTGPALAMAGRSNRHWRLTVDTKAGGIGAGDLAVRVGWIPGELIFTARGNGPFRLAYGNARAETGALNEEALIPGLHGERPPRITLATAGAPQRLAGTSALDAPANLRKWALWAALAVAVAVLAWMAWRLVKQMKVHTG